MSAADFQFERPLHFVIAGRHETGHVRIGPIEKMESGKWACYWSISQVHPEPGRLWGDDPLQAFNRVMHVVGRLLRGSEEDGLVVWWQFEGDHGGFDDACYAPSARS
jgi:hypothetical protein